MRLIDADNLIRELIWNVWVDVTPELESAIQEAPTAYDMDKVIERISLLSENAENSDLNTCDEKAAYNTAYFKAIEAVKSGGMLQCQTIGTGDKENDHEIKYLIH